MLPPRPGLTGHLEDRGSTGRAPFRAYRQNGGGGERSVRAATLNRIPFPGTPDIPRSRNDFYRNMVNSWPEIARGLKKSDIPPTLQEAPISSGAKAPGALWFGKLPRSPCFWRLSFRGVPGFRGAEAGWGVAQSRFLRFRVRPIWIGSLGSSSRHWRSSSRHFLFFARDLTPARGGATPRLDQAGPLRLRRDVAEPDRAVSRGRGGVVVGGRLLFPGCSESSI